MPGPGSDLVLEPVRLQPFCAQRSEHQSRMCRSPDRELLPRRGCFSAARLRPGTGLASGKLREGGGRLPEDGQLRIFTANREQKPPARNWKNTQEVSSENRRGLPWTSPRVSLLRAQSKGALGSVRVYLQEPHQVLTVNTGEKSSCA